jgi:CRP-like cAMP-binding protein
MNNSTCDPVLAALKDVHLLGDLAQEHLRQLAAISQCAEYAAGKVVFREGEPATDVYFVVSGNVALDMCAPAVGCRRILTVGPGELLGWSPLLEQARLTATARTLSDTRAVKLPAAELLALCERDSRLGYELMRRAALALARRLSATRLQLLNVYGESFAPFPDPFGSAEERA